MPHEKRGNSFGFGFLWWRWMDSCEQSGGPGLEAAWVLHDVLHKI